jgi:hypothetical protein
VTIEQLRNLHQATPFRPFTIHLADGRAYNVFHPEFLAFAPAGRRVIVFGEGDSFSIIDLLLVTDLVVHRTPPLNGPPSQAPGTGGG